MDCPVVLNIDLQTVADQFLRLEQHVLALGKNSLCMCARARGLKLRASALLIVILILLIFRSLIQKVREFWGQQRLIAGER